MCRCVWRRRAEPPAGPWVEASGVPVCDTATGVTTVTWTVENISDAPVTVFDSLLCSALRVPWWRRRVGDGDVDGEQYVMYLVRLASCS